MEITIKPTKNKNEYLFQFPQKRGERMKYGKVDLVYEPIGIEMEKFLEFPYGGICSFFPNGRKPTEYEQGLGRGTQMLEKMLEMFNEKEMKMVFCYTSSDRMKKLLCKYDFEETEHNYFVKKNMPKSFSQVER